MPTTEKRMPKMPSNRRHADIGYALRRAYDLDRIGLGMPYDEGDETADAEQPNDTEETKPNGD